MELKELIEKASGKKGVAHCAQVDGEVVKELNDVNDLNSLSQLNLLHPWVWPVASSN